MASSGSSTRSRSAGVTTESGLSKDERIEVVCTWDGKWYAATVYSFQEIGQDAGLPNVEYRDGTKESAVPIKRIRVLRDKVSEKHRAVLTAAY